MKYKIIILLVALLIFSPNFKIKAVDYNLIEEQILTEIDKNIAVIRLKNELEIIEKKININKEFLPDFNIVMQINKNNLEENVSLGYDHAFKFKNSLDFTVNFKKSKQDEMNYLIEIKKQIYPLYYDKKIAKEELMLTRDMKIYKLNSTKYDELIEILTELNRYQYLKKKVEIKGRKLKKERRYYNKQTRINSLLDNNELREKKYYLEELTMEILKDQFAINLLEKRRNMFAKIKLHKYNLKFLKLSSVEKLQKEIVDKNKATNYFKKAYQRRKRIKSLKTKNADNTLLPQISVKTSFDSIYNDKTFTLNISFPIKNSGNEIALRKLEDTQKILDNERHKNIKNNQLNVKQLENEIKLLKNKIDLIEDKMSIQKQKISTIEKKIEAGVLEKIKLKIKRLDLKELSNELIRLKNSLYVLRLKLVFKETLN